MTQADALLLFGVSGDLASKAFPALYDLAAKRVSIFHRCVASSQWTRRSPPPGRSRWKKRQENRR